MLTWRETDVFLIWEIGGAYYRYKLGTTDIQSGMFIFTVILRKQKYMTPVKDELQGEKQRARQGIWRTTITKGQGGRGKQANRRANKVEKKSTKGSKSPESIRSEKSRQQECKKETSCQKSNDAVKENCTVRQRRILVTSKRETSVQLWGGKPDSTGWKEVADG